MGLEHEKLAEDLAFNLGGTPYLDVPLGSIYLNKTIQRADVITIKPSYNRFCLSIYEVKHSRSDFLSDIRTDKWKGYLPHCHRFYFAVEKGVATKEDIPEPAGLIIRGDKGWKVVKSAKVQDITIPQDTMLSLLFMKERLSVKEKRIENQFYYSSKYGEDDYKERKKAFGKQVADILKHKKDFDLATEEYYREKSTLEYYSEQMKDILLKTTGTTGKWEFNLMIKQILFFFNSLNDLLNDIGNILPNSKTNEILELKETLNNILLSKNILSLNTLTKKEEIYYNDFMSKVEVIIKQAEEILNKNEYLEKEFRI